MNIKRMRLSEFEEQIKLGEGSYNISYTDITHLPEGKFINIGEVKFDNKEETKSYRSMRTIFVPFNFKIASSASLVSQFKEVWATKVGNIPEEKVEREYPRRIYDEISQSFVRCRLLPPQIDRQVLNNLFENKKRRYFLISDTNAIKNGLLDWICHLFSNSYNWLGFLIISQIQFQKADEKGKKQMNDPKWSRYTVLRPRTLTTIGTWIENKLKKKFPVEFIDLPPELLRYYGGRRNGEDERVTTILEDRLLIEGIKIFFKQRNISNVERLVVTSDLKLTKFLELEGIPYIYGRINLLNDNESVYSVKYNLFRKDFDFCKIHTFVWDLTHIFSVIKIEDQKTKERLILRYYPEEGEKTPEDWSNDILSIEYFEGERKEREDIKLIESYRDASKNKVQHIGLFGILNIIQLLERVDEFTMDSIYRSLPRSRRYIRRGVYVLEGIGLIKRKKNNFVKTDLFKRFLNKWIEGDISCLHKIFLNFEPYREFINLLCENSSLPSSITKETPEDLVKEIEQLIGNINDYPHLRDLAIRLGEGYLSEGKIYCGTNEPTIEEFSDAVENEFTERRAIGKQLAVSDVVDSISRKLHITPIKFERYINESLRKGLLKNLESHAAAGIGKKGIHFILQKRGETERFRKIAIDASIRVAGRPTKALVLREEMS